MCVCMCICLYVTMKVNTVYLHSLSKMFRAILFFISKFGGIYFLLLKGACQFHRLPWHIQDIREPSCDDYLFHHVFCDLTHEISLIPIPYLCQL